MHYYERHLGDYAKDTAHLSMIEHGAYGLLLDRYYGTEHGIPEDQAHRVARARSKEEKQAVDAVLAEFFTLTNGVWINARTELEIIKAHGKIRAAQENGKKGGRPKKVNSAFENETQEKPTGLLLGYENETQQKALHTPDTRYQVKEEANASVTGKPAVAAMPTCPADDLIDLYHELMPLNPPVRVINEARRKAIRLRWKEAATLTCQPFGYSNRNDGILAWRKFFEICAESEFLTGRAKAMPGKPPFVADIDFLFSPSGFAKCLENKYHREAA